MARVSFVLAAALRDLRHSGAAGAGAVLLTALAVLVVGGTLAGREALGRLTRAWRAELRIVAVLRDEGPRADGAQALLAGVRGLPGVGGVRYVSSPEALAELSSYLARLGIDTDGLGRLSVNPVPARLVVTPAPGTGAASLRALTETLGRLPGVETVQAAVGWVEPVERLERGLTRGGFALGGLLGLAAVVTLGGASVLARQRRVDETAILRLAGTPETLLRAPLLLQSAVQGAAGAALGWSALVLLSEAAAPWTAGWLRSALGLGPLPAPGWPLTGALLAGGVAGGLLGGLGAGRP
jgi:cell division protein FtsX